MPVTVAIPNRKVSSWQDPKAGNTSQLLRGASSQEASSCKQIIQSSFSFNGSLEENHVSASRNGLVWSSFHAYSTHHHLTIRPEDVWFAIVTQISAYINANSEKMRDYFVSHDGQKKLEVIDCATLHTADFGKLSQQMALEIADNIKDPALREWVLPSFSTTTENDRIVGSVLLMGALQKYFSYGMTMLCGIPSVTLLGEVTDYEDILKRLDKLEEMGEGTDSVRQSPAANSSKHGSLFHPTVRQSYPYILEPNCRYGPDVGVQQDDRLDHSVLLLGRRRKGSSPQSSKLYPRGIDVSLCRDG